MSGINGWTAGAISVLLAMFIMVAVGSAEAAPSSSPASISIENLEPGDNQSQVITIYVTGSDNLTSVQLLVTGDTAADEAALQDMVSLYPSYWTFIDNTENKTFTINVMNSGYDGTYTGDIVVSHSAGDNNIPLSVDAGEDILEITGLIPSRGTIAITMTALDSLERDIRVYNRTDYNLFTFDAYMKDIQLYSGVDWITVTFESPYLLEPDNYTTASLSIDPSEVPDNEYTRTLVMEAYHGTTRVYAETDIRITIYGGDHLGGIDVELVVNPVHPLAGENIDISLSHAIEANIWVGSIYVGKTDDNGHLTTSVSVAGEYVAVAMVGDRSIATEQVTIMKQALVAIRLDTPQVAVGEWLRGTVLTTESDPVPNIKVTLNSVGNKSTYTDSLGRFDILTEGVTPGSHLLTTNTTTIGYISYGSSQVDVLLTRSVNWMSWAVAGLVAVLVLVLFFLKRELIMDRMSKVTTKIRGNNPM